MPWLHDTVLVKYACYMFICILHYIALKCLALYENVPLKRANSCHSNGEAYWHPDADASTNDVIALYQVPTVFMNVRLFVNLSLILLNGLRH